MSTATRGRIRIESSTKRVRAYLGGQLVVDSLTPIMVWEKPYYPTYYFPMADVAAELVPDGAARSPSRGEAVTYTLVLGERRVPQAALRYPDSPIEDLRDLVRVEWDAMDSWFEEDEEVFVHARDPYKRVDILTSSRHVRVEVDGVTVAESSSPRLLFETSLPVRYYLPKMHVRMDLLEHSDTVTNCAYKGTAEHWSVRVGDTSRRDLLWGYRTPFPESQKIAGLVCFYNEKVDIFVDGVRQERPRTQFS
ncbi:MAG: DUF427 domain-containing protein [Jatrophihabitantaceae bacterium]